MVAGALGAAGISLRFLEGTWRWIEPLLADPERLFHGAMKGLVPGPLRRKILAVARQGLSALEAAARRAKAVLRLDDPASFFDEPSMRQALDWLSASFSLFEAEVRILGAESHSLVQSLVREILADEPDLVAFSLRGDEGPVMQAVCRTVTASGVPTVGGGWAALGAEVSDLERLRRRFGLTWFGAGPGSRLLPRLHEVLSSGGRGIETIPNLVGAGVTHPRLLAAEGPHMGEEDFGPFFGRPYMAPRPTLPIASNRGCYWRRCVFCPQRYNRFPFQEEDPDVLARWVGRQRRDFGVAHFFFVDECIRPKFALRFSKALERVGETGCRFVAMARPEPAFDEEVLSAMARVGFQGLLWGVESGSDRVLRSMRKGTTTKSLLAVLERSQRAGLSNYAFLMIGFPGESEREARGTLEFLRRNRALVDGAQLSRFVVYEASDVGQHPERYGVELDPTAPRREIGAVQGRGDLLDRSLQDEIYAEFHRNYDSLTSGSTVSFPHHFATARSLLAFLYR